ncbi:hypothetical protein FAZ95_07455 [Trinickia violacea]|uniref:Uncharacterized protein n=1 Tax=Trinickia violacea TaxID=2571746 RepID=A0A4P8ILB4_9BURK|nr:hypothetical protein FAZ95_07455 [Trinickia violacea]
MAAAKVCAGMGETPEQVENAAVHVNHRIRLPCVQKRLVPD